VLVVRSRDGGERHYVLTGGYARVWRPWSSSSAMPWRQSHSEAHALLVAF
jgi:hypothetical protein